MLIWSWSQKGNERDAGTFRAGWQRSPRNRSTLWELSYWSVSYFDDANGTPVLRSKQSTFLPLQPAQNYYPLVSRPHRIRKCFKTLCCPVSGQCALAVNLLGTKATPNGWKRFPPSVIAAGRTFTNEYGRLVWMEYVGRTRETPRAKDEQLGGTWEKRKGVANGTRTRNSQNHNLGLYH